ncbi:hypothetical protein [Moorena sp. SIO3H5]|nr:hypothetical protein [Moorena sp. SIO3H5]NEO70185.1 hypothetical protein [Moorena sp. SIO3H5]
MANITKQNAKITIADIDPSKEPENLIKNVSENELNLTHGGIILRYVYY